MKKSSHVKGNLAISFSCVYTTMGAVWAQKDSNLGTKAASASWSPVRGGALRGSDGKAAEEVYVAARGSVLCSLRRWPHRQAWNHTHPDDEAVTQRQLGLWQRLRVLHGPRTSTPRSQRRTRLQPGPRQRPPRPPLELGGQVRRLRRSRAKLHGADVAARPPPRPPRLPRAAAAPEPAPPRRSHTAR